MSDTLRDQLLGLGFKPSPKPAPKPAMHNPVASPARKSHGNAQGERRGPHGGARPGDAARRDAAPDRGRPAGDRRDQRPGADRAPRSQRGRGQGGGMDLAKAYAIRAQAEKNERIEAERIKQEAARERREAKARLAGMLKDKALNASEADIARHFPYGGKIKRIHVTAAQLAQLNAGELGVVQMDGRYLLVDAATLALAEATFPPAVALKVDPDAPAQDDPYADPRYQVPDDLVW